SRYVPCLRFHAPRGILRSRLSNRLLCRSHPSLHHDREGIVLPPADDASTASKAMMGLETYIQANGLDVAPPCAPAALELTEGLSGDECPERDDVGLTAELGRRLRAAGIPLDRLTLHLRPLHPELFARTVAWAPNEPVEIRDRKHGIEISPMFLAS